MDERGCAQANWHQENINSQQALEGLHFHLHTAPLIPSWANYMVQMYDDITRCVRYKI
jgi:hypothetical protein